MLCTVKNTVTWHVDMASKKIKHTSLILCLLSVCKRHNYAHKDASKNGFKPVSLQWGHFHPDPDDMWVWSASVLQRHWLCVTYTTFCFCRSPRAASVAWWPLLPGPQHQPSAQQFPLPPPGERCSFEYHFLPVGPRLHLEVCLVILPKKKEKRSKLGENYFLFEYFQHTDKSGIQFREMTL